MRPIRTQLYEGSRDGSYCPGEPRHCMIVGNDFSIRWSVEMSDTADGDSQMMILDMAAVSMLDLHSKLTTVRFEMI
jgi:hypothetical protein